VFWVNLQHNNYWFTHLTYVVLLHYLQKFFSSQDNSVSLCMIRWSSHCSVKLRCSFLWTYGFHIAIILIQLSIKRGAWSSIILWDASSRYGRPEAALDWRSLKSNVEDAIDEWRKRLQAFVDEKETFLHLSLYLLVSWADGWLTIILLCYDTVGWVIPQLPHIRQKVSPP